MRKKKHTEHVNHERWLVSWADLLTLLFAFFVVMYASSTSNKNKAAKMAIAMQMAFQQPGAFNQHAETPPLAEGASGTASTPAVVALPNSGGSSTSSAEAQMASAIAEAVQQKMITMRTTSDGVVLSLNTAAFFESGSAEVKSAVLPVVEHIAQALPASPIRVEGHTDNQPIHTAQFRSNWELSSARAAAIAAILMRNSTVSPANFSIAGYGEFHPVTGNDTAGGRAKNRRVDVVLLSGAAAESNAASVAPSAATP